MKQKVLDVLIAVSAAGLIVLIVLFACGIFDFAALWSSYALLGCLLVMFVCLNLKFKKYSEIDEIITGIRYVRRSIASINPTKELRYVKKIAIANQIANIYVILSEFISRREYYFLNDDLAKLDEMKKYFQGGISEKTAEKDTLDGFLKVLDELYSELKKIK